MTVRKIYANAVLQNQSAEKQKKATNILHNQKNNHIFALANDKVPWMSGLVSGLQNRVRRFESARNLKKTQHLSQNSDSHRSFFIPHKNHSFKSPI